MFRDDPSKDEYPYGNGVITRRAKPGTFNISSPGGEPSSDGLGQPDDYVKGPDGAQVLLPKGTFVQVTTIGRHRSTELWGEDANQFNPDRAFEDDELWHDQVYAARNPHSRRFSPFTHTPRDCIGKSACPTPLVRDYPGRCL